MPAHPDPPIQKRRPDEQEPDWVERLRLERGKRTRRWKEVFGTAEQAEDEDPARTTRRPAKPTPSFYDQDEEEQP
jgi:hypothetical protein